MRHQRRRCARQEPDGDVAQAQVRALRKRVAPRGVYASEDALPSLADIKQRFPKPGDVDSVNLARANDLKAEFLKQKPEPVPNVAPCCGASTSRFSVTSAYPDRYLTILKYTGTTGKREIARSLWVLELPDPEKFDWTIGRLILWSNDLLLALLGEGFRHQQHAAEFLWWAKGKTSPEKLTQFSRLARTRNWVTRVLST